MFTRDNQMQRRMFGQIEDYGEFKAKLVPFFLSRSRFFVFFAFFFLIAALIFSMSIRLVGLG